MHYDSFNYILTAFLNILPGDLRALPLEKTKNQSLFEFFLSDSPVTHTPVLLCFLCNLNKQVPHCSILKLSEIEMQAILGHIQMYKLGQVHPKKDLEIASKEAQLAQMSKLHFMQQMLRRELRIL